MKTRSFIGDFCSSLVEEYGFDGLRNLVIVIPSQRVAIYIREELLKMSDQVFWMPRILPINQFLQERHEFAMIDDLELVFELYEAYKETFDQPDSFDDFLTWSSMIISDFNEVDKYLLDPNQVFKNLQSIKDIESWSFNQDELSETQKQFLKFWEKLGELYHKFHFRLTKKGEISNSRIYRVIAEEPEKYLSGIKGRIFFVGFNALSRAEEKIFKFIVDAQIGEAVWDVDSYYLSDPKMEAGKFVRKYLSWSGKNDRIAMDAFKNGTKNIRVLKSNSNLQQTSIASQILRATNLNERKSMAVVFADEGLLKPMLNILPREIDKLNVAMGYPLNAASVFSLFEEMIQVQINIERYKNKGYVYYKDFQAISQHELFHIYLEFKGVDLSVIDRKIAKENYSYLPLDLVCSELGESQGEIAFLFVKCDDLFKFLSSQISFFKVLYEAIKDNVLERESLGALVIALERIVEIQKKYGQIERISSINQLSRQVLRGLNVSFLGEPLHGLQFLGLLETRALDFDHVVLLSCNEDILPKQTSSNSLIPYDLRNYLGLPTKDDKEAIFAYYFYRLIQRAKKIDLIYNGGEGEGMGASEKSRYLLQIEEELESENIQIKEVDVVSEINSTDMSSNLGTNELLQSRIMQWFSNGISASAINTFSNCPRDFLYTQLLRFTQNENIEEDIESSTYGTIVHEVLENMYTKVGAYVGKEQLNVMIKTFRNELDQSFNKRFPSGNYKTGKNLLMYETAIYTVKKFLDSEMKLVEECGVIKILGLEEAHEKQISLSTSLGEMKIRVKGLIDRVDQIGDCVRIVDYKTGVVEKLNFGNDWGKVSKFQLQLMMYLYLYDSQLDVSCGMISFKSTGKGFQKLSFSGQDRFDAKWIQNEFRPKFEEYLLEFVESVIGSEFNHNSQSKYCKLC
ncbi:MAG: PD-(D/E)XK nuclease family protein [Flavobacteriales bacterium]|nr:PD-(D/E)XK nuclease family protein [Flavobacteriales bacterium]